MVSPKEVLSSATYEDPATIVIGELAWYKHLGTQSRSNKEDLLKHSSDSEPGASGLASSIEEFIRMKGFYTEEF